MTRTKQRFDKMLKADNTVCGDVERYQLFYVIARTNALWEVVDQIYDCTKHVLKDGWDELFDGTFGKMLRRAVHMYNNYHKDIDSVALYWGMDSYNAMTMIDAQMIYVGAFDFDDEME